MKIKSRKYKDIARIVRLCCITGALFAYSSTAYATIAVDHNRLPVGGQFLYGGTGAINPPTTGSEMNITQTGANAVIQWQDFSIGTNATVNFDSQVKNEDGKFNVLNYVDSGVISQIYGNLNAEKGNVYLVNTAGALISKSAEINVGNLYVSNQKLTLPATYNENSINDMLAAGTTTSAELMNLGHIKAGKVTFVGDRVVLDLDYLKDQSGKKLGADKIEVKTDNINNVVIGYTAYDESGKTYAGQNNGTANIATVSVKKQDGTYQSVTNFDESDGYMWVKDVEQLQNIETNKSGNYALKNSIDAIATKDQTDNFVAIGIDGDEFTGKFDGLDNNIFGLTVTKNKAKTTNEKPNANTTNVGLFGVTQNATIRNVDMIAGSVNGTSNVGSIVGKAIGGEISNVTTSMEVSGNSNVGGIAGATEILNGAGTHLAQLDSVGTVHGKHDVGGIVGSMTGGTLDGGSFNMGYVQGEDVTSNGITTYSYNIGGLVGKAINATLGNATDDEAIANKMEVSGGYNVGGIVGNANNTNIKNAVNSGDITANGGYIESYKFFSNNNPSKTRQELSKDVHVANVGGIAGNVTANYNGGTGNVVFSNVHNTGNVESITVKGNDYDYHKAGNVGGIVGRASGIDIDEAYNDESIIRGAHNVGGIVGFVEKGTVSNSTNTGEITGTGANHDGTFVEEHVRKDGSDDFIVGNIGGIVGYLYGDEAYVKISGNRGNVHTTVVDKAMTSIHKAANLGGVVGKINRATTELIENLTKESNPSVAAVSDVFNTGKVQGYTGVGGIVGQMYNGEVVTSHNSGDVLATRQNANDGDALNLGGIVGDTTENTDAKALIYDVYNKGNIGDSKYTYYGRHVGGVVGRLSGDVIKSYNVGDIFNGTNVVGGIAGYWFKGKMENVFNTGNITVVSNSAAGSQVGGLAGAANVAINPLSIQYAYNIGTIRSFAYNGKSNNVGGIIGCIVNYDGSNTLKNLNIDNVYVLGNIYAGNTSLGTWDDKTDFNEDDGRYVYWDKDGYKYKLIINAIYGEELGVTTTKNITNTFYIAPQTSSGFTALTGTRLQGAHYIAFGNRGNAENYNVTSGNVTNKLVFGDTSVKNNNNEIVYDVTTTAPWRIYSDEHGTTMPILNAFMPNTEAYFSDASNLGGVADVQYGTAYDPLLTIVTMAGGTNGTSNSLTIDWDNFNGSDHTSIAVYNGGLTLNDFNTNNKFFGGLLYADGALNIEGAVNDIKIGSCSNIYGATVNIDANAKDLVVYGNVEATGNGAKGNVTLSGNNVEIIGAVSSATDGIDKKIAGIGSKMDTDANFDVHSAMSNPQGHVTHIGDLYECTISDADVTSNGDITINATNNVDVLIGVGKQGLLNVPGNLSITATNGNVYVDSDIYLNNENGKSQFTINATNGEVVLDLSNLGEVHKVDGITNYKYRFGEIFTDDNKLTLNTSNAIIAFDMWDGSKFNSDLHGTALTTTLSTLKLGGTITNGSQNSDDAVSDALDIAHIWISNAAQLDYLGKIEDNTADNNITNDADDNLLQSNFALKNDINANHLVGFNGIGDVSVNTTTGVLNEIRYTGTFDGRGYSIVGLDVANKDTDLVVDGKNFDYGGRIGIFNTIGEDGVVKNLKVYHSEIEGGAVGSIAGVNYGTIQNVYTFGNHIESSGVIKVNTGTADAPKYNYWGSAGGVVGINAGKIIDSDSNNIVIAGKILDSRDNGTGSIPEDKYNYNYNADSLAGGVTGFNVGTIQYAVSDSAITASRDANSLGGIAGVSTGAVGKDNVSIESVESYGIVNGTYNGTTSGNEATANNVGGIVGTLLNGATITGAYNEAEIIGANMIGGIVGFSGHAINLSAENASDNIITNVINSGSIDGKNYVGGLLGSSDDTVLNGARNTGEIIGEDYVGGIVGNNLDGSTMSNIVNDNKASITGIRYVGGVAGSNSGTISADSMHLDNNGELYGKQYVGGIVGHNAGGGVVENTINDITLNVNDNIIVERTTTDANNVTSKEYVLLQSLNEVNKETDVIVDAQYFGGVVGKNEGTITDAENRGNVNADGADYVGGIDINADTENELGRLRPNHGS